MGIDWLTVAAQIVNFLVLVWLLRRFLYQPVARAMAAREQRIVARLAEAARREEDAAASGARHDQALAEIERTRAQRIEAIEREAAETRQRLLDAARAEVAVAERRWRDGLAREQREFADGLGEDLAAAVGLAARRCVERLADQPLEARAIDRFVDRLASLEADQVGVLRRARSLEVATAFDADARTRHRLEGAIREGFGFDGELHFVRDARLVLGAELRAEALRVSWHAAEFLREAERGIRMRLAPSTGTPGSASPTPGQDADGTGAAADRPRDTAPPAPGG